MEGSVIVFLDFTLPFEETRAHICQVKVSRHRNAPLIVHNCGEDRRCNGPAKVRMVRADGFKQERIPNKIGDNDRGGIVCFNVGCIDPINPGFESF